MSAALWEVGDSSGVVGTFPTRRLAEIYAERLRRDSQVTLRRNSQVILRCVRSKEAEPGK